MPAPMLPPPKLGNLPSKPSKPSGAVPPFASGSHSGISGADALASVVDVVVLSVLVLSCERGGGGIRHVGMDVEEETDVVISEILFQM